MKNLQPKILWIDDEIDHLKPHILFLEDMIFSTRNIFRKDLKSLYHWDQLHF